VRLVLKPCASCPVANKKLAVHCSCELALQCGEVRFRDFVIILGISQLGKCRLDIRSDEPTRHCRNFIGVVTGYRAGLAIKYGNAMLAEISELARGAGTQSGQARTIFDDRNLVGLRRGSLDQEIELFHVPSSAIANANYHASRKSASHVHLGRQYNHESNALIGVLPANRTTVTFGDQFRDVESESQVVASRIGSYRNHGFE